MRQIHACQASSEKKKKLRKNINTDGNEIADLQEAMRSDSSAVSPHLIWQPSLRGNAVAKSAGSWGRCGSVLGAACAVPVPRSPQLCTWYLKTYISIKTHSRTQRYLTRGKFYFSSGEIYQKGNVCR